MSIVFHDVSAARKLLDELERANRQLESAYEQLQSTNEELETTNEELQSTVEELQTINDTLRERSAELDEVNDPSFAETLQLNAVNRRGRKTKVRIVVGALRSPTGGATEGAILVMEPTGDPE